MNEETLFHKALEMPSTQERAAFLDLACAGQPQLRAAIEALLQAHQGAGHFLNQPLIAEAVTCAVAPQHWDEVAERSGSAIGRYKLLQQIGEGGMGAVWMAEQTEPVERKVALKILKPGMNSREVLARFEAERQALALMDHPNIAKILDAGTTPTGRPYFVMELVKGTPITTYCDEQRLPLARRLELFISVCQAIQHAHQKGIIHRDIKPSNVLVAPYDGKPMVKVIDFGIAKALGRKLTEKTLFTEFGSVLGTLPYMSPEQAELNNLDIDTRSDIYSLGVLLYELLTGTTPLDMKQLQDAALAAILMEIKEKEPPRPSIRLSTSKETLPSISAQRQTEPAKLTRQVRGDLDWIVMTALAKERERRYATATALAADVERFQRVEPIEARPPSVFYRLRKFVRRNPARVSLTSVVFFVVLALGERQWSHHRSTLQFIEQQGESSRLLNFLEYSVLHGPGEPNGQRTLREALDHAAASVERTFHDSPPLEAHVRQILGNAYRDLGALEPAESQLSKSVAIYRRQLDAGQFDGMGVIALSSLAQVYSQQKHYEEEERLRVEVVEHYRNHAAKAFLDTYRPSRVFALVDLGKCYVRQARWPQAEAVFAEVIQECRAEESEWTAIVDKESLFPRSLAYHARCLLARGAYVEAEAELRESLNAMQREQKESSERAEAERWLDEALRGQKKQADSRR